jgi:pantothenate kinase
VPVHQLAQHALALTEGRARVLVGVTGPPGCGKTTLVEDLLDHLRRTHPDLGVAHVPMDGFHLADISLERLGLRHRKGAPETFDVDGYAVALRRMRTADGTVYVPGFERTLEQPIAAAVAVPPSARLVLTEGNYLLLDDSGWQRVRDALDEVWYVDVDDAERRTRLRARHERFGKTREEARAWVDEVDEPNAQLVAGTRHRADRIVPMGR